MKTVGDNVYVHITALKDLPERLYRRVLDAQVFFREKEGNKTFQVVKVSKKLDHVSFLCYPKFWTQSFPELTESWTVNNRLRVRHITYGADNPPILHRRELLIKRNDRRRAGMVRITRICEDAGCFEDTKRIGRKKFWELLLDQKGVKL